MTAQYEKAKSRLDELETQIHDKNPRRKSIEYYMSLLEQQDTVTKYDALLWRSMVAFVTAYGKEDIRSAMKDGTEIKV